MAKFRKTLGLDDPLCHPDHRRPVTRRELIAQGFRTGLGTVIGSSMLGMFGSRAFGLSSDLAPLLAQCGVATQGAGKIPFICFDLAGGANIAGSNVLVGKGLGQLDLLSTSGYSKQGLPGDRTPASSTTNFIDTDLGLAFHTESAMLRGIKEKAITAAPTVNGAVIPARSENDTGNNPHNPMYGINKAGADGSLVTLIGSRNSDSGGNSMAPASMIDLSVRPTKVDRPSDVTGLVDTGAEPSGPLSQADNVKILESIYRVSDAKLNNVSTGLPLPVNVADRGVITGGDPLLDMVRCGYVKSADLAERFGDPSALNPQSDPNIVDITNSGNSIFDQSEFDGDREFRKTASVMKMVIDGLAGAGTISMGGFDYHTGDRQTGERRDLRAGRCIGACLEYAAKMQRPVMIYVCSDGSVFSNGMTDESADGGGKGVWTGDNQQTACAYFLVYNPGSRPVVMGATPDQQAIHQQIGAFRASGDVETSSSPAANNVNLLVETVILNYMALHGDQGNFASVFPNNSLGNSTMMDSLTAFNPIVSGTI